MHEHLLEMKADGTCKLKPQRASLCSELIPTRKVLAAEASLSICSAKYHPFVCGSVAGSIPGDCSLLKHSLLTVNRVGMTQGCFPFHHIGSR